MKRVIKMTLRKHRNLIFSNKTKVSYSKIIIILLNLFIVSFVTNIAFAQVGGISPGEDLLTNPKIRNPIVTATVPDNIPPSAPILISPEDESLLNDGTPTFVWQQSTDNVGVAYYQMYLDGSILFDNIPTVNTSNTFYDLVYDSGSGRYSLTPTAVISNGPHTWRIVVFDAALNNNTSVTWDFIIDTLAPSFTITSIGPISTNISAQDISSVPANPIELENNSPEFIGTGEAYSAVQVTVVIPDESNQIINFTIDENGNWNFQLGILPRDKVITLNFLITDLANNISILNELRILIIQEYIIIPPTPTPIPTPTPTPTPPATTTPLPGYTPLPTPPIPTPPATTTPIIKIPILPPEEIAIKIIKEVEKVIPKPIVQTITQTPETFQAFFVKISQEISPIGVLITTAAIPAFSFLTLLFQLGQQFSWHLVLNILRALGIIPPKEPQGLVYDSDSNKPVSFALITIKSTSETLKGQIVATLVTDIDGIYQGAQLPKGEYVINISHQDYIFPTKKERPNYLTIEEFYRGETFQVRSDSDQQLFLIPVDKITETKTSYSPKTNIRRLVQKIKFVNFFWPLFIISIIITIFYPTIINLIILGLYIVVLFKKFIQALRKPTISGYVLNTNESPVENAIIRINNPRKGELVALLLTNSKGYYSTFLKPDKYQIQITKNGFIWMRKGSQLSYEEINVLGTTASVNAIMKDINEVYKEMFQTE